jgi:hypothetical protein
MVRNLALKLVHRSRLQGLSLPSPVSARRPGRRTALAVDIEDLTDREVLAVLSELNEELTAQFGFQPETLEDEFEARRALEAILRKYSTVEDVDVDALMPEDNDNATAARDILALIAADQGLPVDVDELVSHPTTDQQMSVEFAVATAVILAVLITWLQTKIALRVTRRDGKTEFDLEVNKAAASDAQVGQVVGAVAKALGVGG